MTVSVSAQTKPKWLFKLYLNWVASKFRYFVSYKKVCLHITPSMASRKFDAEQQCTHLFDHLQFCGADLRPIPFWATELGKWAL